MELNIVDHPGPGGVPLLIAHGLFGSARNWNAVARRLAEGRRVLAVDLRNHGESPWSDTHSYEAMAEDLAEAIAAIGGRADVLGHSMGGKAAMVLAGRNPDAVRRLVVADIAPVTYAHSQIGYVEAMRRLDLAGITRRSEADRKLADAVPDRGVRAFLLQSLVLEDGAPRWRLNLETLAAEMPRIMSFPDACPAWDGPALVLRGAASDYVRDDHIGALREILPQARIETIEDAGHWLHAEKPDAFSAAVAAFIDA
jgi:esterase